MARPVASTSSPRFEDYSEIIDVRSPSEFAEDHVPGAHNLYVFDDTERARVGTIYKQESPFKARKLGAALVSANIARWIQAHFIDKPRDYKPLVYCWRGGQRSMSMATVLSRIGWETTVIEGGYKQYRKLVIQILDEFPPMFEFIVVSGLTGTAKTDFLEVLRQQGEQVIDLEGLANHRGSLLGPHPDTPQPSQKYFETQLAWAFRKFDPARPIWIESESNKIGNLHCPAALWQQMRTARRIELRAPFQARVDYLLGNYAFFVANPEQLKRTIQALKFRHGTEKVAAWHAMIDQRKWQEFVASLLEEHYDPAYQSSIRKNRRPDSRIIELPSLSRASLEQAAEALITDASVNNPTSQGTR